MSCIEKLRRCHGVNCELHITAWQPVLFAHPNLLQIHAQLFSHQKPLYPIYWMIWLESHYRWGNTDCSVCSTNHQRIQHISGVHTSLSHTAWVIGKILHWYTYMIWMGREVMNLSGQPGIILYCQPNKRFMTILLNFTSGQKKKKVKVNRNVFLVGILCRAAIFVFGCQSLAIWIHLPIELFQTRLRLISLYSSFQSFVPHGQSH